MRPLNILTSSTSSLKTISILLQKKKSFIWNLLKTKMSKFPILISRSMNRLYSKTNWLNSFLLKTSSMKRILVLSDEEILNLLPLMVYVLIAVLLKNIFTTIIKAKVNINARLAGIPLPLKRLSKMRLVSTVLIANENLLYTMIAKAILFTSAWIRTVPITNIIKKS